MPLLNNDDFEKVLSEAMPWMFDGVMSSGVDALTELANQIHPGVDPLTSDQEARMRELSSRYRRLQPIEAKTPGEMSGAAIPGNVHSVDTRGIQAGAQNVLAALVNRERQRRVEGDPKAVEKHTDRAKEYRQSAEDRLGGLQTPGAEMVLDRKERRRYDRDIAGAERSDKMAERYGGFADELNSYMETVAQGKSTDEKRQKFVETFMPHLFKAQAENVKEGAENERNVADRTSRETIARERIESAETIAGINADSRESVAGLRRGIERATTASSVAELRQYVEFYQEKATSAISVLEGELQKAEKVLASNWPNRASDDELRQAEKDATDIKNKIKAYKSDIASLIETWEKASVRVSNSEDDLEAARGGTIDFDSINWDDEEDF